MAVPTLSELPWYSWAGVAVVIVIMLVMFLLVMRNPQKKPKQVSDG